MSAQPPEEPLTEGQEEALSAVRSLAEASDGGLTVDLDHHRLHGYYLVVRVYLSTKTLLSSKQGSKLEAWEPIDLLIPTDFPNKPPIAWAARDDFPTDLPHRAGGSGFCVRVEDGNWDRSAGMYGFLRAVIDAYQHIALGTLQGHLQPWRPTVGTVGYPGEGWAVIKADTPTTDRPSPRSWRQWAIATQVSQNRLDVVEWLDVAGDASAAANLTDVLSKKLARANEKTPGAFLIAAVVIARPVAVEYGEWWDRLLEMMREQGVEWKALLRHIVQSAAANQPSTDTGVRAAVLFRIAADTESITEGQDARFAVARLALGDLDLLTRLLPVAEAAPAGTVRLRFLETAVPEISVNRVPWIPVYDGRPDSVLRRAAGRPTERLADRRVLLLGCGGLGAPIAEHCVRAGAARLHVVDSGTVSPGVLSRQPYEDADIGMPKAEVLAGRLGRIRPQAEITSSVDDATSADLFDPAGLSTFDLIIDATANRSVAARIERAQRDRHDHWPALITVGINQQATHGVATVTPRGAIGGGVDLLRRLGLKTCESTALGDVHAAFYPPADARLNFRPDSTCSDTTFIGSSTDMSALAAQLLSAALTRLTLAPSAHGTTHRSLSIVRLGHDDEPKAAVVMLDLAPDRVITDHSGMYEVRVDEAAVETIREHLLASVNGRTGGTGVTGGLLLGQFDSACRVAWVSQATGLPRGSSAITMDIDQDAAEVRDFVDERRRRSGGLLTLIGFWHTHLGGSAEPSQAIVKTMRQKAAAPGWRPRPVLLLELTVAEDRSIAEAGSPWLPQVHAETFTVGSDPA